MAKFCINIYWLSLSFDPDRDLATARISLIRAESSLMARSNSLLRPKKFPVRARREFPLTGLKLLSNLAHLLGLERPNRPKFPVFSQLAGNLCAVALVAAPRAKCRVAAAAIGIGA